MLKKYKTIKKIKNNEINEKCYSIFTILYKKNNTFVSYFNPKQKILKSLSTGQLKDYKGFERKTAIASETIINNLLNFLTNNNKKKIENKIILNIKGLEKFKPEVVQLFSQKQINIIKIKNAFGIPHGGCRSKKKRRK